VVGDVLKPGSLSAAIDSTVLLSLQEPNPALIQLDHIRWTTKGLKILSMSPRLKELSILSLFLLCTSQLFHPLNLLADFSLEEERSISKKGLTYTLCGAWGIDNPTQL